MESLRLWLSGLEAGPALTAAAGDVARAGVDVERQETAFRILHDALAAIGSAGWLPICEAASRAVNAGATKAGGILIGVLAAFDEHHPRLHVLRARLHEGQGQAAAAAEEEALAARHFNKRALARLAANDYRPQHVMVQLTRTCNLRCAMCGHPSWQNPSGMMPEALFEQIVAQCLELGRPTLIFATAQGEPLLHRKAESFIETAVKAGLTVNIATNGMPLTPERCDRLAGTGMNGIQFSFAGYDAATYESIYIGGRFETVVRNLVHLKEALDRKRSPTTLWINGVVPADQPGFADRTREFLQDLGIGSGQVALQAIKNFAGQNAGMESTVRLASSRLCRIGAWYAGVYVDGTVTACGCLDSNGELAIGNLHEESLAEMRRGARFQAVLDTLLSDAVATHPLCGSCDQRWAPLDEEDLQFVDRVR